MNFRLPALLPTYCSVCDMPTANKERVHHECRNDIRDRLAIRIMKGTVILYCGKKSKDNKSGIVDMKTCHRAMKFKNEKTATRRLEQLKKRGWKNMTIIPAADIGKQIKRIKPVFA